MATMTRTKPFLPEDRLRAPRPSDHLVRAIAAECIRANEKYKSVDDILARHWPNDTNARLITRAATNPATIGGAGWADSLARTAVADFFVTMGGASVGAQLLARGLQLEFNSAAVIRVPSVVSVADDVGFVAEAAPIGVDQLALSGPTLSPRNFARIITFTRESLSASTPNIEQLTRASLTESVGLALDAALFDANAGDASRPPGLRFGISGITAATGGGPAAMVKDLTALATAVAPVGGTNLAFVASPGEAIKIALQAGSQFRIPVYATSGLAAGFVLCVALNALASAISPAPNFAASIETLLHTDTVPAQIGTVGTPNVVAARSQSLFQQDLIALRLTFDLAWALRNSAGLAWVSSVTW
jgi:Phage capsid family